MGSHSILNRLRRRVAAHEAPADGHAAALRLNSWRTLVFWIAAVFFMELVFKTAMFAKLTPGAFMYTLLFSTFAAAFLYVLTSLFPRRVNRVLSIVLSALLFLFYGTYFIYGKVFAAPLSAGMFGAAGQAAEFTSTIGSHMAKHWYVLVLFLLPLAFACTVGRRIVGFDASTRVARILSAGTILAAYLLCMLSLLFSGKGATDAKTLYFNTNDVESAQFTLGAVTASRLDIQRAVFGFKDTYTPDGEDPTLLPVSSTTGNGSSGGGTVPSSTGGETTQPEPVDYGYNVMDIDFDKLIAEAPNATIKEMHEYFSRVRPTSKNQYTGLFEGCNLIQITAEAFWKYGVSETHTPTLYKLLQEGIQFKTYYNQLWGGSTTTGEFVSMTGLIPSEARPFKTTIGNYLPFAFGNQFQKLSGYGQPYAYHNHKGVMYNREDTHPGFGYIFKSTTDGLEAMAGGWPRSDTEMAQLTVSDYMNQEKFHAYYMTVSGHNGYTFSGNSMARKHEAAVEDLKGVYSDDVRAYIATQIELDKMLEYLLGELEKAGKLDDTVIVINGDHYPYMDDFKAARAELVGHEPGQFEVQESSLIIWRKDMPRIVVDKPATALDIVPTLNNLFGLEYDSRLFSGQDALAPDRDDILVFLDNKWVTSVCSYTPRDGVVDVFGSEQPTEEYKKSINAAVRNRTKYASMIIHNDYYAYVFGKK